MQSEMKMGLGIGLLVLVSVVGFIIINRGEEAPSQQNAMTDAGTSVEGNASTVEVGEDEEATTVSETDSGVSETDSGVSETDSGIRQTGFASARRAEHEASDRDTSDAARDAFSDAAGAPATDSENVGSPSPSSISTGMGRTDRPGLLDSTEAVTDSLGWGGASSADVEHDSSLDRADVEDASVTRDEAGSGLADADRDDATRAASDRGRTAPSAEGTAAEAASTDARAPASIATSHTIEPGDTFSGLAVRYFGHAKYAGLISDANPEVDPRRLHVGKSVKIPDTPQRKERQTEASETAGTVASADTGGGAHSSSVARSDETSSRAETSLPPIPEDRKYVVKATDRGWYDLAERLLGDSSEWTMLYEFNKERLPDPRNRDLLPIGLEIEIPEMK